MTIIVKYKYLLNTPVQYYVAQYSPSTVKRSRKSKDRMGFEGKLLISENARYKPKKYREKGTKHRLPSLNADGQQSQRRSEDPNL